MADYYTHRVIFSEIPALFSSALISSLVSSLVRPRSAAPPLTFRSPWHNDGAGKP